VNDAFILHKRAVKKQAREMILTHVILGLGQQNSG
jgi:hypothetical protein